MTTELANSAHQTAQLATESAAQQGSVVVNKAAEASAHTISAISLTDLDYLILGIILVSVGISLWRGFVKEALSLLVWVVAVGVAFNFSSELADVFSSKIADDKTRFTMSFAMLMASTLMLGSLTNMVIVSLIKKTSLSSIDRLGGLFFGFTRGLVVIAILLLVASFTSLPDTVAWHDSFIIPHFMVVTHWLQEYVPIM